MYELNLFWSRIYNSTPSGDIPGFNDFLDDIISLSIDLGFNPKSYRTEIMSLYSHLIVAKDRFKLYEKDILSEEEKKIDFSLRTQRV